MNNDGPTILITGAAGQIGTALTRALRNKYSPEQIICTDLYAREDFISLDVTDRAQLQSLCVTHNVDTIIHLAAILSAKGEGNPALTWEVNVNGLVNVLEVARSLNARVFNPSSIAVFGGSYQKQNTPQECILRPDTMYGVTKVAGEQLCRYYTQALGVDIRSLRFPGLIGPDAMPGGGTTDYAVAIFHELIEKGHYTCYLRPDTALPMMYMSDAIDAMIRLMEAPLSSLQHAYGYNIQGVSFTPEQLFQRIKKHLPDVTIEYVPDQRQKIADSWPHSIDDHTAREDWGFHCAYNMEKVVEDMIGHLHNPK